MKSESRLINSSRNLFNGVFFQLITTVISFFSRTIFINILGVQYLGINGLFANILSVLSLAELGVGNIVIYSLYKPLAEKDDIKVASLIRFYKSIYNYIAICVATFGLMLLPFLDKLISLDKPMEHVKIYYLFFLANSVISYLFIYKSAIINADQKQYLITRYNFMFKTITAISQIIILYITHNYIIYLFIQVLFTLINNLYISNKVNKLYPYILQKYTLKRLERKKIFSDIKSMFSYKIGGILLNSTDNIFISTMKGTALVGYYSNYLLIISVINTFINMIYSSLYDSIGNLNAKENDKKKKDIFDITMLLYLWIGGICYIGLYLLLNDVITLWIGKEYLLDNRTVAIIVLNFYLPIILYPIWSFRNTTGIFKETRNILTITAGINLIFSYILGMKYGLSGILLSTAIARLLSSFWYEPYILYKKIFKKSAIEYFIKQIINIFIIFISIILCSFIFKIFKEITLINLLFKIIIVMIICNLIYFILYCKSKEFQYINKNIILKLKSKIIN